MRRRGRRAATASARLDERNWLAPRDAPAISPNVRGFPKLSRYSRITSVRGSSCPVLEQIVGGDVGLVADGHEAREPQVELLRALENREAQRSALRSEGDRPGRGKDGRERRVQSPAGRC